MATAIPAPLKAADVQRFAVRASQVERAKPAAAYWCYYYVLDKILSKGLHKASDESQAYVVELMDKVEKMKTEHADDDAMRDDMAGKAYIEQFGLETFMRADNAIRSNKATKQTADTFQAAYTFLDLLNIWPPVDPEIVAKIKFAKYHAVRIAKAIKAGEDPNLTNPAPEADDEDGLGAPVAAAPALDADDPEVRAINGLGPTSPAAAPLPVDTSSITPISPPPATTDSQSGLPQFVDGPPVSPQDDGPISLPPYPNEHSSHATQAMPHQNAESFYQNAGGGGGNNNTNTNQSDVSPLPQSDSSAGYFPPVPPSSTAADGTARSPGVSGGALSPSLPHQARPHQHQQPPSAPQNPRSALGGPAIVPPPPNPADASSPLHLGPSHPPYTSSPSHASTQPVPGAPAPPFRPAASPAFAAPHAHAQPPPPPMNQHHYQHQQPAQQQQYVPVEEVDEEAMVRAQKHARFAISALNFEDVATAVKELRAALADLGAR